MVDVLQKESLNARARIALRDALRESGTLASGRGRLVDACACLPFGSPTLNGLALPIFGCSGYSRLFPLEMFYVEGGRPLARSPMIADHVASRGSSNILVMS